jgi:predicted nucleic acid-binding protein
MTPEQNPKRPPDKLVLLDTNVLIDNLHRDKGAAVEQVLTAFQKQGFVLAVSVLSRYEGSCHAEIEKVQKFTALFDKLTHFNVNEAVSDTAATLFVLYKKHDNIQDNAPSTQDVMIAATSVNTNLDILTADRHDFPAPYFFEVDHFEVGCKIKGRKHIHTIFWLRPSHDRINTDSDALKRKVLRGKPGRRDAKIKSSRARQKLKGIAPAPKVTKTF